MGGRRNSQTMLNPRCNDEGKEREEGGMGDEKGPLLSIDRAGESGVLECVQRAGDLMFVPKEWSHQTVNLQPTLAIAQEFCDCVGTCCGSTCSATAALLGDDPDVFAESQADKDESMLAMQTAINMWQSLDPDLQ